MFDPSTVGQFLPACHCMIEFDASGPCPPTANQKKKVFVEIEQFLWIPELCWRSNVQFETHEIH